MKTETQYLQDLQPLQRDFVETLKSIGFKYKYFTTYELKDWGEVNIDKIKNWSDLLKLVFEMGQDQKRFEIQRVIGI